MEAYSGYAKFDTIAGASGICTLWNPVDSGVTLYLDGVTGSFGAPVTICLMDVTTPIGTPITGIRVPRNVNKIGPPCKAILHEGVLYWTTWDLGNCFADCTNPTNFGTQFEIKRPYSIPPGYGILSKSNVRACSGDFTLQWTENAIP